MADNMRAELVIAALQMAVNRRRPDPGLIHHSDQGSQFVALGFGQACSRSGISRSMGSTGQCWDNAVAETFFATLKKELVYRRSWPTRRELEVEIVHQQQRTSLGNLTLSCTPNRGSSSLGGGGGPANDDPQARRAARRPPTPNPTPTMKATTRRAAAGRLGKKPPAPPQRPAQPRTGLSEPA